MKRSLQWALVAAGTASVLAAGFVGGRAWAGGIPSKGALTYSGVLQKPDGSALTSTGHNLEIKLWSTGPTGGTVLCTTAVPAPTFTLDNSGRFSVQLDDACTGAIGANAGAFVEVLLDGNTLGRTKLGAVPYAIEANHAVSADSASSASSALDARIKALEPATKVSAWTAFTPELVGSAKVPAAELTSAYGNFRRVGDSIEVSETVRFSQSSTDNTILVFKLPMGLEGYFPSADPSTIVGAAEIWNGTTVTPALVDFSTPVDTHGVTLDLAGGGSMARSAFGNPGYRYVSFHFTLPVSGWTASSP